MLINLDQPIAYVARFIIPPKVWVREKPRNAITTDLLPDPGLLITDKKRRERKTRSELLLCTTVVGKNAHEAFTTTMNGPFSSFFSFVFLIIIKTRNMK